MTLAGPVHPPYLITVGTDGHAVSVAVSADASSSLVEMAVHGTWSRRLGGQVAAGLETCLAGPSASIIVDLHDLQDPHGVSMPFWLAASQRARHGRPPVHLALALSPATALGRRLLRPGSPRTWVFGTMPDARAATVERLPRTRRLQSHLKPDAASVRAARDLVAQACQDWELAQLRADAALIMSELAANAVQHARTEIVVTVSWAAGLHLAVRDGAAQFPRPPRKAAAADGPTGIQERGRGLHLVHAVAAAWGAMPTRGGKVVWATVCPPEPAAPDHSAKSQPGHSGWWNTTGTVMDPDGTQP